MNSENASSAVLRSRMRQAKLPRQLSDLDDDSDDEKDSRNVADFEKLKGHIWSRVIHIVQDK